MEIYFTNQKTGKRILFETFSTAFFFGEGNGNPPEDINFCRLDSLSPFDRYLVFDCGGSPIRGKTVYRISDKKEVANFSTPQSSFVWTADDKEAVFLDPLLPTLARPWEGGEGMGISIIDLASGVKSILRTPTAIKEYEDVSGHTRFRILPEDIIEFTLTEVSTPDDWLNSNKQTVTHWLMKKNGEIIRRLEE